MKRLMFIFSVMSVLFPQWGGCISSYPIARVTLLVVNQDGMPVTDTKIRAGFEMGREGISVTPNRDGIISLESPVIGDAVFFNEMRSNSVRTPTQKDKYYKTLLRYTYGSPSKNACDGKWQPWNPTIEMVLKERVNPIPMYATGEQYRIKLPRQNEWFGFDLMCCDLLPPNGNGKRIDIMLRHKWEKREGDNNVVSILQLRFPEEYAGLYWFECQRNNIRAGTLRSPYHAKVNEDYTLKEVDLPFIGPRGYRSLTTPDIWGDKGIVFRTRTRVDESGNLLAAFYGKLYAPEGENVYRDSAGNSIVQLHYYLNPTENDTNLEFDPKRNLLKNVRGYVRP